MSDICIYVKLPTYLRQWFVNLHGGEPVHLARGSAESDIVKLFITKCPEGLQPQPKKDDETAICVPFFKHGPDARYNNYLPPRPMKLLVKTITATFRIHLNKDLSPFFNEPGNELQDLIYSWMEKNGIEATETNWCAISRMYLRMRDSYQRNQRRLRRKAEQKAKKHRK